MERSGATLPKHRVESGSILANLWRAGGATKAKPTGQGVAGGISPAAGARPARSGGWQAAAGGGVPGPVSEELRGQIPSVHWNNWRFDSVNGKISPPGRMFDQTDSVGESLGCFPQFPCRVRAF
eukprot:gene9427-biopygen12221